MHPTPRRRPGRLTYAAGATLGVRALGVLSQALVVASLGLGRNLDAYFVALILPMLVVVPLAAAVEASVTPRVAAQIATGRAAAIESTTLGMAAAIGAVLAAAAFVLRQPLSVLSAPAADASLWDLAVVAAGFVYPSIAPMVVTAAGAAVLFGRGRLVAPVLAGAWNPVVMVAAIWLNGGGSLRLVAGASLVGSVLEALTVLLIVRRPLRFARPSVLLSSAVALELRRVFVSNVLLRGVALGDQLVASGLGPGAIAQLGLARRFFDVAGGAFILPGARLSAAELGRARSQGALVPQLHREERRALSHGTLSAAALVVGSPILLLTVYRHGEFSTSDAIDTISTTWILAIGMVVLGLAQLYRRLLVIAGRSEVMLRVGLAEVGLNLALDVALAPFFGVAGIAFSTSVTYHLMVVGLRRKSRSIVGVEP